MMKTPPTLRSLMDSGFQAGQLAGFVSDPGDLADLAYIADQVERHDRRLHDGHRQILEQEPLDVVSCWKLELHGDAEIRRWFLSSLDAVTRAELDIMNDMESRPFLVELDEAPFRCSNCGVDHLARHMRIVDRCELLGEVVGSGDLRYCRACLTAIVNLL